MAKPDGFRLDAVKHVPLSYWAQFNVAFAKPGFTQLGELLDGDPSQVARVWRDGHFTAMFDFPLGFAMGDVFCRGQSPVKLAAVLTNDRRYPDPSKLVTLLDNHDLPRIATVCGHDENRIDAALTFMLAMRGIPSLSWGTEIGLDGEKEPDTRKSMRFITLPVRAQITAGLTSRSDNASLSDGSSTVLEVDALHVVVGRATPGELSVVVVNQSEEPYSPSVAAPWPAVVGAKPGVSVSHAHGDFAEFAKGLDTQWRTGAKTVPVTFTSSAGGKVVGSGGELGDWDPSHGVTLPATIELPQGGVFEFKRVTAAGAWVEGENQAVFIKGLEPIHVELR